MRRPIAALIAVLLVAVGCQSPRVAQDASAASDQLPGWSHWRGPHQNGVSDEVGLPDSVDPARPLWTLDMRGRGTPVTLGDRVYSMGYSGVGPDLREYLVCLDINSGHELWRQPFNDFLSDIIYERYSIGAPSVEPSTGRVYAHSSAGELACFEADGTEVWRVSLLESYGRLTFPNGRTGTPTLDGNLVIVNMINSSWGAYGPARNRYYAFHQATGELVWTSTPGVGPPFLRDSSFSTPVFETRGGLRLMYGTTGCGNVVCVNARTGEPLWRYQMSKGGVNSSPVIDGDQLIAVHGKENTDDTGGGRMVALDLDRALAAALARDAKADPLLIDTSYERWRNNDVKMFTSSPVVHDGRIYQCSATGELYSVDSATGRTAWHLKLGADQLHASPVWADGKLYIPTWHDGFQVVRPHADHGELLSQAMMADGELCIGSPAIWRGRILVHTTSALYCFGPRTAGPAPLAVAADPLPTPGVVAGFRVAPAEILLRPGDTQALRAIPVDATGYPVLQDYRATLAWEKWVPPSARVKAEMDADLDATTGLVTVRSDALQSAGAIRVTRGDLEGSTRGRILPQSEYHEDFEGFDLTAKDASGGAFAYPPLPWIGGRLKWEIRDLDGNKVLQKTLDMVLFQRSMVFLGHEDDSNYEVIADVMSDGSRRNLGIVGVINQRYIISLVGNWQILEISSNHDRIKFSVPYAWKPKTWYRLRTAVVTQPDGSAIVKAKVWPRDEAEPAAWTIEMPHAHPHTHGSPGLFGFSPQSQFPVYIDNIHILPQP